MESNSALRDAARGGRLDVVRLLLAAGADPNATAGDGCPALWHAAAEGHVDVVRLLLDAGAIPDVAEVDTQSTPLFIATIEDHVEVARLLLEAGADTDAETEDEGGTPLLAALQESRREIALLLVSHGACFPEAASFPEASRLVQWLVDAGKEREARHAAEVARLRLDVQSLQDGIPHLLQAAMRHAHR